MFAPRIKWEALEGTVEDVKDAAEKYENAFNDIISTVKDKENFKEVSASSKVKRCLGWQGDSKLPASVAMASYSQPPPPCLWLSIVY